VNEDCKVSRRHRYEWKDAKQKAIKQCYRNKKLKSFFFLKIGYARFCGVEEQVRQKGRNIVIKTRWQSEHLEENAG